MPKYALAVAATGLFAWILFVFCVSRRCIRVIVTVLQIYLFEKDFVYVRIYRIYRRV